MWAGFRPPEAHLVTLEIIIGGAFIALVGLFLAVEWYRHERRRCPDCAKGLWRSARVCPNCGHAFPESGSA
jgi:hypothetical protein